MRTFLLACIGIALLVACKPGGSTDTPTTHGDSAAELETALMTIHDSAMVRLNEINKLSGELRDLRAEVNISDEGSDARPAGMDMVLQDLKLADQGMWDWMKAYGDNKPVKKEGQSDASFEEDLLAFYQKEMQKITSVDSAIDMSIANAKNWLTAHAATPK